MWEAKNSDMPVTINRYDIEKLEGYSPKNKHKEHFKMLLQHITSEQEISMLGIFFNKNREQLELSDLCKHNLVKDITAIQKDAERYEKVQPQLFKDIRKFHLAGDMKEALKIKKRHTRYSEPLYFALDKLRPQYTDLFNRVNTLMKIIYAYENDLKSSEISHLTLTMPQLINKTFGLTRQEKDGLYNFNSMRNILSHQEVTVQLSSFDWTILLENIIIVDKATTRIIAEHKEELVTLRVESEVAVHLDTLAKDKKAKELYLD